MLQTGSLRCLSESTFTSHKGSESQQIVGTPYSYELCQQCQWNQANTRSDFCVLCLKPLLIVGQPFRMILNTLQGSVKKSLTLYQHQFNKEQHFAFLFRNQRKLRQYLQDLEHHRECEEPLRSASPGGRISRRY